MFDSLLAKIKENFPTYSDECVRNFLLISVCILNCQTVCLNRLKSEVGIQKQKPEVQLDSHYKFLCRFFCQYGFSRLWLDILRFCVHFLHLKSKELILDGTSWEHGKKKYHFMVLSVIYQGVAVPIYWEDLKKKGISNQDERKRVLQKALKQFDLTGMTLLADREYIGDEWFKFLDRHQIKFVIRLKHKTYQDLFDQEKGKSYAQCIAKIKRSKVARKTIAKTIYLNGLALQMVLVKNRQNNPKEPVIFLISNLQITPQAIAESYTKRWMIENLFKHLKTNGLQIEKLNLGNKYKNSLLLALVVFLYVLSIQEGLKTYQYVNSKKYANNKVYKQESLFRYGCNLLALQANTFSQFLHFLIQEIKLLKHKYHSPKAINVQ